MLQYAMADTETTDHQWEQFYRNWRHSTRECPHEKSTITIPSDMDIDAPSLAWEEAEPPPPPPPPQQQQSPSPLPPPEKPEKKPQLTGQMTRFGHLPLLEVVVVDVV